MLAQCTAEAVVAEGDDVELLDVHGAPRGSMPKNGSPVCVQIRERRGRDARHSRR
jgi:hypothetical protein